jgi:ankyrin repeat protein
MATGPVPPRGNLEFYRKAAKALLRAARSADAEAAARLRSRVPRLQKVSGPLPTDIALHDAQLTIARENGFDSWPRLYAYLTGGPSQQRARFRPHVRGFQWYEERVPGIVQMHRAGLPQSLAEIRRHHPKFHNASDEAIAAANFTKEDARLVLADEHGFENWDAFKTHIEAIAAGQTAEPFTAAFDAIQNEQLDELKLLLARQPDLATAEGTNGSTLLNLACSMRRPKMCLLLIEHGADVDQATTRGVTPLHQAAYNNQPHLIELLLAAGASPAVEAYGDGGTPLVMALFWGHDAARELLAQHGLVPDNLRVAAGVGRLDLLAECVTATGDLTPQASAHRGFYRPHTSFPLWHPTSDRQQVLDEAFVYASRNNQIAALEFLLAKGANIDGDPYRGTALLWAAWCGRNGVVEWLLDHGAQVNRRATFGGPTHGQGITALHLVAQSDRLDLAKLLVQRGADATICDEIYNSPTWGWAEHDHRQKMFEYLKPGE